MQCLMCDSDTVPFRRTNLLLNGNSLIEVDLSGYCLRCGNIRIRTLREICKEGVNKLILFLLPEEISGFDV